MAQSEPEATGTYEAAGGHGDPHAQARALPPAQQRQPLTQAPQRQPARTADPRQSVRGNNGLFAAEPAAPPPMHPAPRRSLFGIVTGAMRGGHAEPPPPPQPQAQLEPSAYDARGEQVRANVRQAAGEDMHIDIPAFLRRQSS
jgi:cell division protein FtsZ